MPPRFTRAIIRARVAVLAVWVAALLLGVLASGRLSPLLAGSYSVPGTDSDHARAVLQTRFGERPDGTFTVVFRTANVAGLRARLERAAAVVPTGHAGALRHADGIAFGDIATTLDLAHAKRYTAAIRRSLDGSPAALVTGQPAVQADLDPVFSGDLHRGEAIAIPLTLLVLLLLLGGSLAVLVPLLVAACTISTTLGAVYVLAHDVSMVVYVRNLVELIGLGLAVDYSLLVVLRFREELDGPGSVDDAVIRTAAAAGRAVAYSGVAVAAGLGMLLFVPVPFIRSLGIGGLLVPLVSVAAALTLQPALLSVLGRRLAGRPRGTGATWARFAHRIMRRPRLHLALGVAALVALAAPIVSLRVTPGSLTGIPSSNESVRGYNALRAAVGGGVVTPTHVVVEGAGVPAARATARLADALFHDPETLLVATGRRPPFVAAGGVDRQLIVANRHEWGDDATRDFVDHLRHDLIPAAGFPLGTRVSVGGAPAQGVDFVDRTSNALPPLVAAIIALTLLVLVLAFRSIALPLKAVLLNILSVGAAYGVLALAFRHPIEAWVPVFLFATLFGLSMDYEVFMVSRMREAHDAGESDGDAVEHGLERSGRIVSASAAIMVAAFLGFAAGRIEGLREFGVGLAVAVTLDATIVRGVLVPSLMAILGRWNWWLPKPPRRA